MIFSFFRKKETPAASIVESIAPFHPYVKEFNLLNTICEYWIFDQTCKEWYEKGFEKSQEVMRLSGLLKPTDEVLEFGVHYGFIGVFLSKKAESYLGIELSPEATMYAQAQFKLNELGEQYKIMNAAGSNTLGFINYNQHFSQNLSVNFQDTGYKMKTVTGDSLMPSATFLKIDVEGYEVQVLEGCKAILENLPKIAIEIHLDMLAEFGKKVEEIWHLIPIDRYTGAYFHNPTSEYIDPASHKMIDFELSKFPKTGVVNLFLTPKTEN